MSLTLNYLGQIERGKKWPALEALMAIADTLTVSPAAFFDFEPGDLEPAELRKSLGRLFEHSDKKALQRTLSLQRICDTTSSSTTGLISLFTLERPVSSAPISNHFVLLGIIRHHEHSAGIIAELGVSENWRRDTNTHHDYQKTTVRPDHSN
jgi:transcriptional regulator with XRE-family HTH domain